MGANPWHYFTPYHVDINAALQALKEQEFRAGRYGSDYRFNQMGSLLDSVLPEGIGAGVSTLFEQFNSVINQPKPSAEELIAEYGSVLAAMEAVLDESEEDGTQSILDMTHVSNRPEICAVCALPEATLQELFQTHEPTRAIIEATLLNEESIENWEPWESFWESIDRGEGRYIILYEAGKPVEIFFAGYSFD